ncbi:MAG: FtsW/RodA/SpoVE family cell cycle protein [Oscillospiraceae bacterium]|nr:FtsW/RodA/SpoVE family cell cycle protein [Oscillospiraceae bacterium]
MDLSSISQFFSRFLDTLSSSLSDLLSQEEALLLISDGLDAVLSFFLPLLAILVVVRCARSLLQGKLEWETWGWLTDAAGESHSLHHWEVLLGRSRSCDVVLADPTVSRNHAALTRDDKGNWFLHPLRNKNGVFLNGKPVLSTLSLSNGDVVGLGAAELSFQSITHAQEEEQAQNRTRPGKEFSPGVTLFLLSLFQAILCLKCVDVSEPEYSQPIYIAFGVLCLLMWLVYTIYRILRRTGFEIETLAFFLTSLCLTVTAVSTPSTIYTQLLAVVLGLVLFFALSIVLRDLEFAKSLRWPAVIGAGVLLAFNLLLGETLFGAKNWVSIGPLSFQPSELVKVIFILAGATTLDRMFARRNLIFTLVFSAYCVGCLALMSDFGTAVIFFVAFLAIAFLRSGDFPSVCFMAAAAVFAGFIVLKFKPYIANRFAVYRHVWEDPSGMGYQQTRTLSAMASGGLFGQGVGGGWLKNIGAANTDLVFGVLAEELGLIIAILAVLVIILLALFAVKSSVAGRSSFYVIAACSTAMIFVVQTMLNVFGSTDLLPLTGVTFPFVSCGGSSMMACWCLLAYIKASDTRQNAGIAVRLPKRSKKKKGTSDEMIQPPPYRPAAPAAEKEGFREDEQTRAATQKLEQPTPAASRRNTNGFSARLSVHREEVGKTGRRQKEG